MSFVFTNVLETFDFYQHSFVITSPLFLTSTVTQVFGQVLSVNTPGENLCDNVRTCSRLGFLTGGRTNLILQITLQMSHSFPSI